MLVHSDDTTTGLHNEMHLPVCALPQFWVTNCWKLLRRVQFVLSILGKILDVDAQ